MTPYRPLILIHRSERVKNTLQCAKAQDYYASRILIYVCDGSVLKSRNKQSINTHLLQGRLYVYVLFRTSFFVFCLSYWLMSAINSLLQIKAKFNCVVSIPCNERPILLASSQFSMMDINEIRYLAMNTKCTCRKWK